jgi:hypothetical protein
MCRRSHPVAEYRERTRTTRSVGWVASTWPTIDLDLGDIDSCTARGGSTLRLCVDHRLGLTRRLDFQIPEAVAINRRRL